MLGTNTSLHGCIVWYPFISSEKEGTAAKLGLEAVIEATIDRVIEGRDGWCTDRSRRENLSLFKIRNKLGKQNHAVYRAALVDRWTFGSWLSGKLPDSAGPSRRIEAVLRTGVLSKSGKQGSAGNP